MLIAQITSQLEELKRANKPTLILAKKQTKGKGQYGRKWISYKGNVFLSIYFSVKKKALLKSITKKYIWLLKKVLTLL